MPEKSDGPSWAQRNMPGLFGIFILAYLAQHCGIERMRGTMSPETASLLQQILHAVLLYVASEIEMGAITLLFGVPVVFLLAGVLTPPPCTVMATWWGSAWNGVQLASHAGLICAAQCSTRLLRRTRLFSLIGLVGPPLIGGLLLYLLNDKAVGDCSAQDLFLRAQVFENSRLVAQAGTLELPIRLISGMNKVAPYHFASVGVTWMVFSSLIGYSAEHAAGYIRATTPSNMPALLVEHRIDASYVPAVLGLSGYSRSFRTGGCGQMQFPPTGTRRATESSFLGTPYAKNAGVACAVQNHGAVQAGVHRLWQTSLTLENLATKFNGVTHFDVVASTQGAAKAALKNAAGDLLDSAGHALVRYGTASHAPVVIAPVIPAGCPVGVAGVLRMYTEYAPTDQIGGWALIADVMATIAQTLECQILLVMMYAAFTSVRDTVCKISRTADTKTE